MQHYTLPLSDGHQLLEYCVLRTLGQGGFGTTYLCLDGHLQKKCVVKEFTPHGHVSRRPNGDLKVLVSHRQAAFDIARIAFLSEARKLARFTHPNIARVSRYFECHNTAYFVMDYEAGGDLRSLFQNRSSNFTEEDIDALILPLCRGISELHKSDLIHRDIKPENIIVRPDGSPVLIDFGAAIDFRTLGDRDFRVIATPAYAPIEQFDINATPGPWIDLYAMGAIMYEMIAGISPTPSLRRAQGAEMIPASEAGRGKYGDRLLSLVDKCLAMDFVERPQNINEFTALLELKRDALLNGIINDITLKMVDHFTNFANPNDGLYSEEFIAFTICFPIVDLSWRIGRGMPDKETFFRLHRMMHPGSAEFCLSSIVAKGFTTLKRPFSLELLIERLDEYAASYVLDRQETEWRYESTCQRVAKNCLAPSHAADTAAFIELIETVIDRARGRIKRGLNKALRNVVWHHTPTGWVQEIIRFDDKG